MSMRRDDLINAMQDLIDAHARGRAVMDTADSLLRFGIRQLESGADFVDMMADAPTAAERQATLDAFDGITAARHAVRLLLLEACLDQGMSPREIGERWGVSRQRVATYVAELKEQASREPAPAESVSYVHASTIRLPSD